MSLQRCTDLVLAEKAGDSISDFIQLAMTTNSDILSYLKASQDDLAKEKEEDKIVRAKERQEDMETILAAIKSGVQKEVRATIKPLEERLEVQEKLNKELTRQFNSLLKEVEMIQETIQASQNEFPKPSQSQKSAEQLPHIWDRVLGKEVSRGPEGSAQVGTGLVNEVAIRKQEMCASARKIIGFAPIEPRMLDLQIQSYGAKNLEEAKEMEVRNYLKCEMKMKPSDISKLNLVKIFPPAKENWNVLYVEFGSDPEVDMVMSHTRHMVKQDHRVLRWYPKQMYVRYRAVETIAYEIRKNHKYKTRVKIGRDDIELSVKDPASTVRKRHLLPDSLPEFEMTDTWACLPSSPPPGRPGSSSRTGRLYSESAEKVQENIEEPVADSILATKNN